MSIQYIDPRAKPLASAEHYTLRSTLEGPVVIGLLANGFPDSVAFLKALEPALAQHLPDASFRHYNKGNASVLVSPSMLNAITDDCAVAIAAYGH